MLMSLIHELNIRPLLDTKNAMEHGIKFTLIGYFILLLFCTLGYFIKGAS